MMQLADAIEANIDELSAIEALDNGKPFSQAKAIDLTNAAGCIRYYVRYWLSDSGSHFDSISRLVGLTRIKAKSWK